MNEAVSLFDREPAQKESPNPEIDATLKRLMKKAKGDDCPPETAVKIINSAIAWEKVKHHIKDENEDFDPDL